jgi:hypothetical protein
VLRIKVRERGIWRTSQSLDVRPSDPSEMERVAVKYMKKKISIFDTKLNILIPTAASNHIHNIQYNLRQN